MGFVGTSSYTLTGGKVFGTVPYFILEGHLGNESSYYVPIAFNLMNFFEFVSDQWISLRYQHRFEGFLLNKVPLIKKLKWRFVGTANILWGDVSNDNIDLSSSIDENGDPTLPLNSLGDTAYIELGYGVENILKVFRIDFFHRLTYLGNPDVDDFGIKFRFQFLL